MYNKYSGSRDVCIYIDYKYKWLEYESNDALLVACSREHVIITKEGHFYNTFRVGVKFIFFIYYIIHLNGFNFSQAKWSFNEFSEKTKYYPKTINDSMRMF